MAAVLLVRLISVISITLAVVRADGFALAQTHSAAPGTISWNDDSGVIFQKNDFRITAWGYAERLVNPDGNDGWRRVRQGAEFDLSRLSEHMRPAIVYEVDLVNSNFFHNAPFRRNFENLYVSLQDADDPGKFHLLFGHNTHILSRDDNLSSGNLPTINRSLILEEHGSVNAFGAQMGFQVLKALSPAITVQASIGDNRGSLNATDVRSTIGNSFAGKILLMPIDDAKRNRKLTFGFATDLTRNITDRIFTLASAIGQNPLGGVAATGEKLTLEADAAYGFAVSGHLTTIEAELIHSRFSQSHSDVFGGYGLIQTSLFDNRKSGDLDLFIRYDFVNLGQDTIPGRAHQSAVRTGLNYNLPATRKHASFHVEYAHNALSGPAAIVNHATPGDEIRLELRVSLQSYVRQ